MGKIVGFDIGENSVKMAYYVGKALKKAAMAELPDAMVSQGRILSMDAMADFLRDAAKRNGIPLVDAALALPSADFYSRTLTVPAMTELQLRYNLPYEFHDFLTEEKSKYFFDYSVQNYVRDEAGEVKEIELFACAMLKSQVEAYRAMFRRAGFKLKVLTPSESAYGALLADYMARTGAPDKGRCIVSLGHASTYLHIFQGDRFDSRRGVEIGGAELDRLIADHCGVDIHVAHGYKESDYNGVLESDYARELYGRMAAELMRAVNFYNYNNRDRELHELYLCGGGGGVEPMCRMIAETTGLTILPAKELLPPEDCPAEPWLYLRAASAAYEAFREGSR